MLVRILLSLCFVSFFNYAQDWNAQVSDFIKLYNNEVGDVSVCSHNTVNRIQLCSPQLRNEHTGPLLLLHTKKTNKVVVLFHGLSDSPFYFRSVANAMYQAGNNVVVAMLPGHGLKEAKAAMTDKHLARRWQNHVEQIIEISKPLGEHVYLAGFSTGAALALNYGLRHEESDIKGFLMFSGAFALNEKVENLASIPGIKWVTRWLDRDYQSIGNNPYKYPDVSKHSATMLMDIINENRTLIENEGLNTSLFFAHSRSDVTTPIKGVETLIKQNQGISDTFFIEAHYDVCHGNLVLNSRQVQDIGIKDTNALVPCALPEANPVHNEMLEHALNFLEK